MTSVDLTHEEVAQLRTLFVEAGSKIEALEAINAALRNQTSDGAADLQCDVMMALRALRPARAPNDPARTTAPSMAKSPMQLVLQGVLADVGLTAPDGRPLHRYRVTNARFGELKAQIERLYRQGGAAGFVNGAGPVFVLYCAEWFRRDYDGGHYAWKLPYPPLFAGLSNPETRDLTHHGLRWWRRPRRYSNGQELRLRAVILEGGFPTRLLESNGAIANHLKGLIARLERRSETSLDEALALSVATTTNLHQFENADFHLLCAELGLAILGLRKEAQMGAPDGVSASLWLDSARPGWRDELPISLSGDGARRLLDDLVSERVERLTSDAACTRLLIRNEAAWTTGISLGMRGEVAIKSTDVSPSAGRLRVFAAGALAGVFAGDLGLLEPPTEVGEHWLCRPRGGELLAPFDVAQPVVMQLRAGDARPIELQWPKGEPRRSELLIFADERGDDAATPPEQLTLIGTGSLNTRRRRVYLWTPGDFAVTTKVGGEAIEPIWQGERRLFEVSGPIYAGSAAGSRYRVEVGAEKDTADLIGLAGSPLRGLWATDKRVELWSGRPKLTARSGAIGQSPKAGQVRWRPLGTQFWSDWVRQPPPESSGLVEIDWPDETDSVTVTRDRRLAAIFPDGATITAKASGALGVAYALENLGGWTLTPADPGLAFQSTSNGLLVHFTERPVRRLHLMLSRPGLTRIAVTAPTRLKSGGFARADGTLFGKSQRVMLDDLRGATAFADGKDRVYLDGHGSGSAHVGFEDEISLWSFSDDISRMLADGALDTEVDLELGNAEGRRLTVGRYAAEVGIRGGEVTIRNEPIPTDLDSVRELAGFSLCNPGLTVLQSRSWRERTAQPHWILPDELAGPGLVMLCEAGRVIGRPAFHYASEPVDESDLCRLARAAMMADYADRQAEIDAVLDALADATPEASADRAYLMRLVCALGGVPASAFDVLNRWTLNTSAQAALLAAAANDEAQGHLWKLDRELPVMWGLLPIASWVKAFAAQTEEISQALAAGGLAPDQVAPIVHDAIGRRGEGAANLDPLLRLPLCYAGAAGGDGVGSTSLESAAQDWVRRTGDQAGIVETAAAKSSCFRSGDSQIGDLLPATWPFHPVHWEGLDAACAAAISAAGRARPAPREFHRIRAAQAQEPLSFADLYAASLRLLARNQPLAC